MAQWNKDTQDFLNNGRTLFEVNMLADKDGNIINSFGAASNIPISAGTVDGYEYVFRSGYNPNLANATEESVWLGSSAYPWSAWDTANTVTAVSSTSDTGDLQIYGLDENYEVQVETVTLTGTSPVTTQNTFKRINNVIYQNSAGTSNAGNITVQVNSSTVGYIPIGYGASRLGTYTVPAGKTAYMMQGTASIGKGQDGLGKMKYRLNGGSFVVGMVFQLYQNQFEYSFASPIPFPEKCDIDVTITASAAGSSGSCAYDLILVDNA